MNTHKKRTFKRSTGSGEVNFHFFITIEQGLKEAGFQLIESEWLNYPQPNSAEHS